MHLPEQCTECRAAAQAEVSAEPQQRAGAGQWRAKRRVCGIDCATRARADAGEQGAPQAVAVAPASAERHYQGAQQHTKLRTRWLCAQIEPRLQTLRRASGIQ